MLTRDLFAVANLLVEWC